VASGGGASTGMCGEDRQQLVFFRRPSHLGVDESSDTENDNRGTKVHQTFTPNAQECDEARIVGVP
jgi:hypothetical protein